MNKFMEKVISLVRDTPSTRRGNYDDFSDRLSSQYTVGIIVAFSLLSIVNLVVQQPMTCFSPAHFEKGHVKFANSYCWIKNTYYLQWEKDTPSEWNTEEGRQMITYYQWIPFILMAQAILFYLPKVVWRSMNSRSGVDCDDILKTSQTLSQVIGSSTKTTTLKMLTNQIDEFLNTQNESQKLNFDLKSIISATCCRLCGKRLGNYLLLVFLFSKVCYIVNVIGQMFLLNVVLSTRYNTFGFDIVNEVANNKTWFEGNYAAFPRVTLCDFEIRGQDMTNVQRYTIQCALHMNLYNEMIYIFLWFWMVFVAFVSCVSLLLWVMKAISRQQKKFVKNKLILGKAKFTDDEFKSFFSDYLRQDGCLLLRLITNSTNYITTSEITYSLFYKFAAGYHEDKEIKESRVDAARKTISDDDKDESKSLV